MMVPPDTPEVDERCRAIERGGRIVTAIPSIFAVVLQMPRGNLETIYPRGLVLAGIRSSIDDKSYLKAFSACRTQRIDLNILYDHNPEQFLELCGEFVSQIKRVDYLDLFIAALKFVPHELRELTN
jgi:elongator complex protein 1